MKAIRFIETRKDVQVQAFEHIRKELEEYHVETRGVYIQDVILPAIFASFQDAIWSAAAGRRTPMDALDCLRRVV